MDTRFLFSNNGALQPYRSPASAEQSFSVRLSQGYYTGRGDFGRPDSHSQIFAPPPLSSREHLLQDMEERIREEVMAREAMLRRAIEEQVRREIALSYNLERELAMRMHSTARFPSALTSLHSERQVPLPASPESAVVQAPPNIDSRPFQRLPPEERPGTCMVKPVVEVGKEPLPLDKLAPGLQSSLKRKAPPPTGSNNECARVLSSPKRDKNQWSCALCQISTTSRENFNVHLKGKKHMAKQSELRATKAVGGSEMGTTAVLALKIASFKRKANIKRGKQAIGGSAKTSVRKNEKAEDASKRSKYFCKFCEVKCFSLAVMTAHCQGKKHKARIATLEAAVDGGNQMGSGVDCCEKEEQGEVNELEKNSACFIAKLAQSNMFWTG